MIRLTASVMSMFLAALNAFGQEPTFTFIKSESTGKHISIQPKEEHHRIYFPLRVTGTTGRTAFARVRCKPATGDVENLQTVNFKIAGNNELWRVYLRAPRHETETATYQVEVGVVDTGKVDPEVVLGAFAWQVQRAPGEVRFVTEVPNPAGGTVPVTIPIVTRVALAVGGEVRIEMKKSYSLPPKLIIGLDQGMTSTTPVQGGGAVRIFE
jgi:hypothetical protein